MDQETFDRLARPMIEKLQKQILECTPVTWKEKTKLLEDEDLNKKIEFTTVGFKHIRVGESEDLRKLSERENRSCLDD